MIIENKECVACGNTDLVEVLDLGDQPLANSYLKTTDETEYVFPLKLNFCKHCTHLQLSHSVNPDALFKNYLYVSGTSQTGMQHFKDFVSFTEGYVSNITNVLDIACNDGSQLAMYKDRGYQTFGIDPAENLLTLSSQHGKIICDYLKADNINSFGVKFDVIIAQNVFAHNNYPMQFLEYCKSALSENGRIFVQTSQANMVANGEFDTIYHEHLSFFNVRSMAAVAKRAGLEIVDVVKPAIHGTSYVFILAKNTDKAEFFISQEKKLDENMLMKYANNANKIVSDLNKTIEAYRKGGYIIVGYGAAAKGNTLLNFGHIDLDYIVDDNALKHGLYTPGMRIEIKHPDYLMEEKNKTIVIPLAWNFYDEIKKNTLQRKTDVKFIKYFPRLSVES